jgi:anti-sigma B factor antagonist
MSNLEIQTEAIQGVPKAVVVHIRGALDQPTLETFLSTLKSLINEGNARVVLDMQGVTYANSTALGALVTQADAFRDAGGELLLVNPQPKVNLVIEMLGLNTVLPILGSLDEARARLAAAPTPPVAAAPRAAAAPHPAAFPVRNECSGCGVLLEFAQAGRFRCPHCGTVYAVDQAGRATGTKPRGGQPIEIALTCHPRVLKAFERFIGALPAWDGYTDSERQRLESAIGEVCGAIHQKAYEGSNDARFHLLVVSRDDELALRIADHGKPLDASAFPIASAYMTEFEHRPHPTRGNYLRMLKRGS